MYIKTLKFINSTHFLENFFTIYLIMLLFNIKLSYLENKCINAPNPIPLTNPQYQAQTNSY